jgi:hypothetical protein
METQDNKFYFKPVPDDRTYENAMIKASFLTDNLYVRLSEGLTYEDLVEQLIKQDLNSRVISHGT